MKKILFFVLVIICSINMMGQTTVSNPSDTLANDSLIDSRTEFSFAQANTENENFETMKQQGDSAYMRNDYATAIQIYEKLLEQGAAAELYYNLGNSYYKSDDIARAILNYERALLLAPGNSDIRANLEIARSKTIDKVTPIPEIFFMAWIHSLMNSMYADTWGKLGIGCFFVMLASLCLFLFSNRVLIKKIGFAGGIIMLIIVVTCNVFADSQKNKLLERKEAIVLTPSITVRSTPSESGTSLFVIHEGHKVEIKDDTMHEWKEIRLEDGKVGWIPSSSIEII